MSISRRRKSALDPKETFLMWVELGTLDKVSSRLKLEGVVNPYSNTPYTVMAIYYRAMKWVLEHPDEARQYYVEDFSGFADDDERWNDFLVEKALNVLRSRVRVLKWMREVGIDTEKYKKQLGIYD